MAPGDGPPYGETRRCERSGTDKPSIRRVPEPPRGARVV